MEDLRNTVFVRTQLLQKMQVSWIFLQTIKSLKIPPLE